MNFMTMRVSGVPVGPWVEILSSKVWADAVRVEPKHDD